MSRNKNRQNLSCFNADTPSPREFSSLLCSPGSSVAHPPAQPFLARQSFLHHTVFSASYQISS